MAQPPGIDPERRCSLTKAVVLETENLVGEGGFLPALSPSKGSPQLTLLESHGFLI